MRSVTVFTIAIFSAIAGLSLIDDAAAHYDWNTGNNHNHFSDLDNSTVKLGKISHIDTSYIQLNGGGTVNLGTDIYSTVVSGDSLFALAYHKEEERSFLLWLDISDPYNLIFRANV